MPQSSDRDVPSRPMPLDADAPRALTPKRNLLHARHRAADERRNAHVRGSSSEGATPFEISTADGAVTYSFARSGQLLCVRRIQRRPLGTHSIQSVVLATHKEFERWIAGDSVRFDYPLVFEQLRAAADAHFTG